MPKIMIETGMTEMPKGCYYCDYWFDCFKDKKLSHKLNDMRDETLLYKNTRPDWCPLVEKED